MGGKGPSACNWFPKPLRPRSRRSQYREMPDTPSYEYSVPVNQAFGIVAAQIGGTVAEAIPLVKDRASELGVTLEQIADAIIDGTVVFDI